MEEEARHLRALGDGGVAGWTEAPVGPWRRSLGHVRGVAVELVVCGIGGLNAALCAATLFATPCARPDALLNFGCAGAHDAALRVGDVVVATTVGNQGSCVLDGAGNWQAVGFRTALDKPAVPALRCDDALVACAIGACSAGGALAGLRWVSGHVGSTDTWTQHAPTLRAIHAATGSLCEDMEAAALALACVTFCSPAGLDGVGGDGDAAASLVPPAQGVRFLTVKDIANNELVATTDHSESTAAALGAALPQVGARSAAVLAHVIGSTAWGP